MAALQARALIGASPPRVAGRRRAAVVCTGSRPQVALGEASLPPRKMTSTADPLKMATKELPTRLPVRDLVSASEVDDLVTAKLYAVMEAAAERAEMHDIIGTQRNNWNLLLLNSINAMTLAGSISAGLSAIPPVGDASSPHLLAFKISSAVLYSAATVMLLAVNKIQPSQLAEEQRNAARLFRVLERNIQTTLALRTPTPADVEDALDRVLALDKAYPLSLLPGMLEKFPEKVEPTVWWPQRGHRGSRPRRGGRTMTESVGARINGWSNDLQDLSVGLLETLKSTDTAQYLEEGALVVKINKALAVAGPVLTGLAAAGAALMDSAPALGPWPVLSAVVGGALATAVNTLEHGAQVGMIFELFRNCAGYYRRLEEEIELNLEETEMEERENGEIFELKMALQLGRSLADLRSLSSSSTQKVNGFCKGHAGKLF